MRRRPRELSLQQCYAALGIEQGADLEALKHAYRRRAFELHPDLHPENPRAGREFQMVNEAYVVLTRILGSEQKDSANVEKDSGPGPKQQEQTQEQSSSSRAAQSDSGDADDAQGGGTGQEKGAERQARRAGQAAYAKEEDVLRDLLNDPFARRVFEDIYTQMNDARPELLTPPPQADAGEKNTQPKNMDAEWGREHFNLDFSQGIGKTVKGWMRKQIDEEQTFHVSPAMLKPGARIRLQIRRGIGDEVSTVEIRLPRDYAEGKSVRLKGLGKRIGRWQGDLYLTLVAKQPSAG